MVIRRYLAIGAAALTVGLAVFLRAGGTALAVLLGLCLALGLIKALRPLWRSLLCGLLAAALMGGLYAWRYTAAEQLTGCELPFTGTVLEVSPYTAHRSTIYARVGGQHRVIDLTAYLPEEETPLAGERIAGTLTITGAESEGDTLLLSGGVALKARQLTAEPAEESFSPLGWLLRLRRQTIEQLNALGEGESAALVAAMLTADTADLPAGLRTALSRAGISHLLAVSGLHLALLCGLLGFGRKWKFYKPLILLRAAAALFYLLLTGMPVSVSRAGIVLLVALVGDFFLLPPDLLTSTSFAAILLGLQNAYAPCDLGFQLSFCAVLGVQAAAALARTEQRAAQDKPAAVKALCQVAEPVQTAVLASLATLPVLVAHGMAASLVGVLCNLLVVWMVQPALQLGILLLVCSAVPFLAAITNLTALVLSLWLKGLLWLVRCCAALPFASICLPQRYTLFALAVLGALAVCFWHARRLRLYLPAAALCTVLAVGLGVWMQRDVVQINLVGASNNPCVVCVQNGQAVVFFRGGESNRSAVQNYLAGRSRQEPALVVDLRARPTQMEFSAAEVVTVQELADFTTRPVLDGLTLDLYHNKSANLAVLGVGERHIAVGAGRLELAEPVRVDVLCAPGTLSDSVQPDTILYTAAAPRWLDDAAGCTLRYGEETPGLTLRPGRSMIWEEAQTIAVQ